MELREGLRPEGLHEIGRKFRQRGRRNRGVIPGLNESVPIGQPEAEERFGFVEGPILVREGVGSVQHRIEFGWDDDGQKSERIIQSRIEEGNSKSTSQSQLEVVVLSGTAVLFDLDLDFDRVSSVDEVCLCNAGKSDCQRRMSRERGCVPCVPCAGETSDCAERDFAAD